MFTMSAQKNTGKEDGGDLRRMFPKLSENEYLLLKSLDALVSELEKDKRFRSELVEELAKRNSIKITVHCTGAVERSLKLIENCPECTASPHRAVRNVVVRMLQAAIEQSNGE